MTGDSVVLGYRAVYAPIMIFATSREVSPARYTASKVYDVIYFLVPAKASGARCFVIINIQQDSPSMCFLSITLTIEPFLQIFERGFAIIIHIILDKVRVVYKITSQCFGKDGKVFRAGIS